MKIGVLLFISFTICIASIRAQTTFRLNGTVLDKSTHERLEDAFISVSPQNIHTITDPQGQFEMDLEPGRYKILISYLGYRPHTFQMDIRNDTSLIYKMIPSSVEVESIEVKSGKSENSIRTNLPGEFKFSSKSLKKFPSFMGETDMMRAIRLLPGVQSGGEGNSGIYVRGGNAGQNLFLLDGTPLYNPSHLLGTFPVFNTDAMEDVTFLKGGIPARYGSKISSVTDITMKEGSYEKFSGCGSLGILSSDITLQAPFHQGKGSVIVSGRRMYMDLVSHLSKPFLKEGNNFFESNNYYFYDSNIKIAYKLTTKDKLYFTAYTGRDHFGVTEENFFVSNLMHWGNTAASLKFNHIFNGHFMGSIQAGLTDYRYSFNAFLKNYTLDFYSNIRDKYLNMDFIYVSQPHLKIHYGLHYTDHQLVPNRTKIMVDEFQAHRNNTYYSDELSGYVNAAFEIRDQFSASAGLRFTRYRQLGPHTYSTFNKTTLKDDSISFEPGETIETYHTIDPNLMLAYHLNDRSSLKSSLSMKHQFIHLASVGAVTLPSDIWLPSTDNIQPQKAGIMTFGYFQLLPNLSMECSAEIFYKKLWNQIELLNGPIDNANNLAIEENVLSGSSQSFGAELFFRKQYKNFTGWLTYTLSKTSHTFETINLGRPFPAKYDRTHDLSINFHYSFNKQWEISSVYIYNTGNAMSLPEGRYIIQGNVANHYTTVNGYRMPPYHRLDLSINYKFSLNDLIDSSLNFSIYNAYNRANPYYIYFGVEKDIDNYYLSVQPHQISLFPVLPSVTWNFTF